MSKTPFMPLWVSDFLGDTLDLDAQEVGAYLLLLMAQWNRDGKSLPDDPKKLQRVARCGRNWPKVWGVIGRFFKSDDDGIYSQRLRQEAQIVAAKREVNSHNGARGGAAKALKVKDAPLANASHSLQRNASIPEPEPERSIEQPKGCLSSGDDATPVNDVAAAFSEYNQAAEIAGWPSVRLLSKPRRAALQARLAECGGIDGWRDALAKARASPHLCGQNDRGWTANFDFLTTQKGFAKLMEGNYDKRTDDRQSAQVRENRIDPALANIARLTGLDRASSNGGG